jgi:hypothetical protein
MPGPDFLDLPTRHGVLASPGGTLPETLRLSLRAGRHGAFSPGPLPARSQ